MGKNDDQSEEVSDGTDALSLSAHDSDLSDNLNESDSSSGTSEDTDDSDDESDEDDDDIDTDIEEQLCSLEEERQKILKKLKKFELEKKRKKIKRKLKRQKEKKQLKKLKKKARLRKRRKKKSRSSSSSSLSSSSSSDSDSDSSSAKKRRKKKWKKRRKSKSTSSSSDDEVPLAKPISKAAKRPRKPSVASTTSSGKAQLERRFSDSEKKSKKPKVQPKPKDSPIVINESESESSVDEAPITPALGSRLGPSKANAKILDDMEKRMNPIEKFHQERSDQDITGRIINGRKIVVKTVKAQAPQLPLVQVVSSGHSTPNTNSPNQRNNSPQRTLSDRFAGSTNRREDRKLNLLNPLLRKAKFYIVKSVFDENIDISQEKGVWATLPHNEKKFNHAFCEVENVFFFFIVNSSQHFRGFARMRSPARKNREDIHWKLPDKMKTQGYSFGEVLKIDWISNESVPYEKVRDLRNQLNKNNPVWAGRDGQEIDPETGRDLTLSFAINRDITSEKIKAFKVQTKLARQIYFKECTINAQKRRELARQKYKVKYKDQEDNGESSPKRARRESSDHK